MVQPNIKISPRLREERQTEPIGRDTEKIN